MPFNPTIVAEKIKNGWKYMSFVKRNNGIQVTIVLGSNLLPAMCGETKANGLCDLNLRFKAVCTKSSIFTIIENF